MGVLIDASILIEAERGRLDLAARVSGIEDEEFFVSVVTASELLHGVHRAVDAAVRARRGSFVNAVLDRFPILSIDLSVARAHSSLWSDLSASGSLIGPNDLWLAASCIAHDLRLVTANTREFGRVPGLRFENWLS